MVKKDRPKAFIDNLINLEETKDSISFWDIKKYSLAWSILIYSRLEQHFSNLEKSNGAECENKLGLLVTRHARRLVCLERKSAESVATSDVNLSSSNTSPISLSLDKQSKEYLY